ncbi:MAG TPA: right-handed parallel beta-helix repeat-containing protein, partial [Methylococcales bacterium]
MYYRDFILFVKVTAIVIVILFLGSCALSSVHSGQHSYYVDANTGQDTNPGTKNSPFKTLKYAQAALRRQIASGMKQDVTVFICPGKYYLDTPLIFDSRDSGRDGHRVIYKGVSDTMPEIIGGKPISGWAAVGEGVYKAPFEKGRTCYSLMENGESGIVARTPNQGYFAAGPNTVPSGSKGKPQMHLAAAIKSFDANSSQMLIWPGYQKDFDGGRNYDWSASLIPVQAIDWDLRMITLKEFGVFAIHAGNRYYLRNALQFLDAPGEFYVDAKEGFVYYYPRAVPIERQEVVAATTPCIFELGSISDKQRTENVVFENIKFCLSDGFGKYYSYSDLSEKRDLSGAKGLLTLVNARNISVRNCSLRNAGYDAIACDRYNEGHRFENNFIENAGRSGISFCGESSNDRSFADEKQAYINHHHTVKNNYMQHCGRLIGQGAGVEIFQAGDIEIANNLFENMPRYAIGVFTGTFSQLTADNKSNGGRYGKQITWDNHWDFNFCRNINVHHNECRKVMNDSQDGGAINFYGVGRNNRIENNLVHDIAGSATDSLLVGIYVDDGADYFVVKNNIITRVGGTKFCAAMIIKGIGHHISNNIIANCQTTWGAFFVLQTPLEG